MVREFYRSINGTTLIGVRDVEVRTPLTITVNIYYTAYVYNGKFICIHIRRHMWQIKFVSAAQYLWYITVCNGHPLSLRTPEIIPAELPSHCLTDHTSDYFSDNSNVCPLSMTIQNTFTDYWDSSLITLPLYHLFCFRETPLTEAPSTSVIGRATKEGLLLLANEFLEYITLVSLIKI